MSIVREGLEDLVGSKWTKRLIGVGSLLFVYLIVSFVFHVWPFSVAAGLAKSVVNERSIITNYEWYYDQYNAIKAQKANVQIIKTMPVTEKQQTEIAGTMMVLNSMIAEYNSRSKQITRNLWKAKDIPYQINLEDL